MRQEAGGRGVTNVTAMKHLSFFVGNILKIKTKHREQVEANVETSVFFVGNIL